MALRRNRQVCPGRKYENAARFRKVGFEYFLQKRKGQTTSGTITAKHDLIRRIPQIKQGAVSRKRIFGGRGKRMFRGLAIIRQNRGQTG